MNDKSLEVLKNTFKEETPPIITYTLEEYFKLIDSGEPSQINLDAILLRTSLFKIKNIKEPSAEKIYQYFHELKTNDIWLVSKDLYNLLYIVPLIQVPLYINHKNLASIAKWRMDIAK